MASTIILALSAFSPANHSLRTTLMTKISGGSDNVIPLGMKSNTKPYFRGLRDATKDQASVKINACVYRQNFTIGSYEIGPNRLATIGSLLNHLQDAAANLTKDVGLVGDGFNSTPEMTKRNLIWAAAKMQVIVDRYPSWGDVVEIDTWFGGAPITNGFATHWLLHDANTGETLARANSVGIMMNKKTRKISKIPEEVRDEMAPHTMDYRIWDDIKLSKLDHSTADFVQSGLIARWSHLDVNHHVNFSKYIEWILEIVPTLILESFELCDLTVEFKKECGVGDELKSFIRVVETGDGYTECQHMLLLENGKEVTRGRTKWRPAKP